MDIDSNLNGNLNQVGDLTVLIGSDPFLPQPESPTEETENFRVDEDLNTPPLSSSCVISEYQTETEHITKPLHPYLEADICLDEESKQILKTPSSPLEQDLQLTELTPVDPDIFVSPPPRKRKRKANPPINLNLPEQPTDNILYNRTPTPIPTFVPPPPQENNPPVRPLLLVQPVHIFADKNSVNPPSLLQLTVNPTPDLLYKLSTSRIPYVTSEKRSHK